MIQTWLCPIPCNVVALPLRRAPRHAQPKQRHDHGTPFFGRPLTTSSNKENVGSCCGTKTMAKAMLKMPWPAVCPPGETSEKRIYFVSKIDLYNLHIYRNSPENFLLKSAEILKGKHDTLRPQRAETRKVEPGELWWAADRWKTATGKHRKGTYRHPRRIILPTVHYSDKGAPQERRAFEYKAKSW